MSFKVVIPARYGSQRLPGKPLREIAGKAMILHVIDQARKTDAEEIIVATDHEEIYDLVDAYQAKCLMTSESHRNGSERITEVSNHLAWGADQVVVNLQGDEPLMLPSLVNDVANLLIADKNAAIATLCTPIKSAEDFHNPNIVKVVYDQNNYAQYFSRSAIPFCRDDNSQNEILGHRHIGLYAYRVKTLNELLTLPETLHEKLEKLEQLRALGHGMNIKIKLAEESPEHGVDTLDDLFSIEKKLLEN